MRTFKGTRLGLAGILGSVALAACDLTVTNPGPVADESLNSEASFRATLNGAIRSLSETLSLIGVDVAIRTREMNPTALNDYFGIESNAWEGVGDVDNVLGWGEGHDARWLADDAVRRFEGVLGGAASSDALVAEAYLWGGYAYRLMGEYFCEAVFDGGPAMASSEWFTRAESRFTSAETHGQAANRPDIVSAARAGRASVRVSLGDWSGAVDDAGDVTDPDFSWSIPYYSSGDWRLYNVFYYYSAPEAPSQVFTTWNTVYEDYYTNTSDPRTPWVSDPDRQYGSGSLQGVSIPWWRPTKHGSSEAPIEMSSYEEMRLIEAENLLRGGAGNISAAMDIINGLRSDAGVADWPTPADLDEAWGYLKRERGIELWLEGRRLADFRRWDADGTPGALDPLELGLVPRDGVTSPDLTNADLCMPIPNTEREQNDNLPVL
jgi:hypothetical protein